MINNMNNIKKIADKAVNKGSVQYYIYKESATENTLVLRPNTLDEAIHYLKCKACMYTVDSPKEFQNGAVQYICYRVETTPYGVCKEHEAGVTVEGKFWQVKH